MLPCRVRPHSAAGSVCDSLPVSSMNKNMSFRSSKDSKANSKVSSGNSFKVTASRTIEQPDHVTSYFRAEWLTLLIITISGLIYNIGLLAGPWFEGQLAQMLYDIFRGSKTFSAMVQLAVTYIIVIALVQGARAVKRLYVRYFANNINRSMKEILYGNLIHTSASELASEGTGTLMTKAISDVDACSEGMRKFTTEIFDTGVALAGFVVMLLVLDLRLGLLCLIFPPISYICAEKMKSIVTKTNAAFKESAGRLSSATVDRVSGAVTYRVYGCEQQRNGDYENHLADYEKTAVRADVFTAAMPPLYLVISQISFLFILYFGVKNVRGTGWRVWDIASFTAFVSCYSKLAVKSSHAAKLFNAVHKAEVSWRRIVPFLKQPPKEKELPETPADTLEVRDLAFAYPASPSAEPEKKYIYSDLSFKALPGAIIGVTGPVACGKSTLGKTFLCEAPYEGSIRFGGKELSSLPEDLRRSIVGYLGHDPELLSDTIENNILMRRGGSESLPEETLARLLETVCLSDEVKAMPDGVKTRIGSGGVRLSGGQQQRVALARTLSFPRPIYILDDPFSALDRNTEVEIFRNLQEIVRRKNCIVLLLSHRLYLFPKMNQVIWMENGKAEVSTHEKLMNTNPEYRELYNIQDEEEPGSENSAAAAPAASVQKEV